MNGSSVQHQHAGDAYILHRQAQTHIPGTDMPVSHAQSNSLGGVPSMCLQQHQQQRRQLSQQQLSNSSSTGALLNINGSTAAMGTTQQQQQHLSQRVGSADAAYANALYVAAGGVGGGDTCLNLGLFEPQRSSASCLYNSQLSQEQLSHAQLSLNHAQLLQQSNGMLGAPGVPGSVAVHVRDEGVGVSMPLIDKQQDAAHSYGLPVSHLHCHSPPLSLPVSGYSLAGRCKP